MSNLLHHPYTPPKVRLGEPVEAIIYYRDTNEVETRQVIVTGWSSGRIKWPMGKTADGSRDRILLCGDLVRAVSMESVASICHWWGVSRWTVQRRGQLQARVVYREMAKRCDNGMRVSPDLMVWLSRRICGTTQA